MIYIHFIIIARGRIVPIEFPGERWSEKGAAEKSVRYERLSRVVGLVSRISSSRGRGFRVFRASRTFHACPDLICIRERAHNTHIVRCRSFSGRRPMSCSRTRYSLSLNNLLLTCRGNPLAGRAPRPCTDLQASSKFQLLHVRGTANVDYRAVCRTPYS